MNYENVIEAHNIRKKFRKFELNIPQFTVPKGFSTALIGENGSGKTTLLNILSGIRLDYKGDIRYFNQYTDADRENNPVVKERIGYTGTTNYYLPHWNVRQVEEVSELLFEGFDKNRFHNWCEELAIFPDGLFEQKKKIRSLSDGNQMKLKLAGVMARDTDLLILDEPASPLDPLMREKLCEMIQTYVSEGNGERSVLFSTHNISDMENVTDYAIIVGNGGVLEAGFVEELKEKYVLVKGDVADKELARKELFSISENPYGFEGICLSENLEKFAGCSVLTEIPSLFQISVAVMKQNSRIKMG